jgi:hypothetical protein
MPYPHVIRLRGPWQETVIQETVPGHEIPDSQRQQAGLHRYVCFERSLGRPSQIDENERVWLVVEGLDAAGEVTWNDKHLGPLKRHFLPLALDVTDQLESRNRIALKLSYSPPESIVFSPSKVEQDPCISVAEVRLEICSSLRPTSLATWCEATTENDPHCLRLAGRVESADEVSPITIAAVCGNKEIVCADVAFGKDFTCSGGMCDDIPIWRKGERNLSVPVEVKIFQAGQPAWQTAVQLACRVVEPPEIRFDLDTEYQAHVRPKWFYTHCDQEGINVMQAVPGTCLAEITSRLAHHASISTWVVPDGEPTPGLLFGRRVLAHGQWT